MIWFSQKKDLKNICMMENLSFPFLLVLPRSDFCSFYLLFVLLLWKCRYFAYFLSIFNNKIAKKLYFHFSFFLCDENGRWKVFIFMLYEMFMLLQYLLDVLFTLPFTRKQCLVNKSILLSLLLHNDVSSMLTALE